MFYNRKHSNYVQHIHYLIICFKSYLCSTGRVRNVSDADVCYFSVIFFLCLPTFWFRGFVFEWD